GSPLTQINARRSGHPYKPQVASTGLDPLENREVRTSPDTAKACSRTKAAHEPPLPCVQSSQLRGREIGHAERTRRPDSGSAGALVPARRDAVAEPWAEQGHCIQRSRTRRTRPE